MWDKTPFMIKYPPPQGWWRGTGMHSRKRELPSWSRARMVNAFRRDFTINSLLFEPFSKVLFDYYGGLQDCQSRTLRTLLPEPSQSFQQVCGGVWRCVEVCGGVWRCVEVCGDVERCAAIDGVTTLQLMMDIHIIIIIHITIHFHVIDFTS